MTGRYFKIETLGAVDGPGLRFVLFLQGCNLRCPYCHNPESWNASAGDPITADEVLARMARYRGYYRGGGITVSGGEPLVQAGFVLDLLRRCREAGFHTAVDTAACVEGEAARQVTAEADLLLLDIKHTDPDAHRRIFAAPLDLPLGALRLREALGKPVWIRHVVAPGLGDTGENMLHLAGLLRDFTRVERVELLPFRRLCLEKYEAMNLPFPMADVAEMDENRLAGLAALLRENLPEGITVS